ncbi:MAG: hypothetical protein A3H94_00050 [Acidobacteria bacterium RIFCSPLOWO2_02_FULL_60_20]|nr:MAG: hypothetical protein A3H94_00050 [Acidobacteria bacterium RIFCSPLOWO2_02_FULL_60_20]
MLRKFAVIVLAVVGAVITVVAQIPDRSAEVAKIQTVIAHLNEARRESNGKAFSQLFTADGEFRFENEGVATGRDAIEAGLPRPKDWSEVTAPRIENESVRFLSANVALVDASQTQYGSLILKQSVPVLLLLKRDAGNWRIISLRIYRPWTVAPSSATPTPQRQ